jgi:hypothetical protein
MRDPVAAIEALLVHPFAALAVALILLVIGWRMDSSGSYYFLFAAWVLLTLSAFRVISGQPLVLRVLLTMLLSSVVGLLLYSFEIRTAKRTAPHSAPVQSAPAGAMHGSPAAGVNRNEPTPTTLATPTSDEIAEAIVRRSEPKAPARARRYRLRRDLTRYLVLGAIERDAFRRLLQPMVEEGTRKPIDNTRKIGEAMLRIQKWDTELVAYIGSRLGGDKSLWMMSRAPSSRYPSNIGDVPGLSDTWDVVTSDIAKTEELLRELPDLPGGKTDFEYTPSHRAQELFEWQSEPIARVGADGPLGQRLIIRAKRTLKDPLFEVVVTNMTSLSLESHESFLITTTPVREGLRWYVDVLHPLAEGGQLLLLLQANEPIHLDDVRIAFW